MSSAIDVFSFGPPDAELDQQARISSTALIDEWTLRKNERRRIYPREDTPTPRVPNHQTQSPQDSIITYGSPFLALPRSTFTGWLAKNGPSPALPTDWTLADLETFEPAPRKRRPKIAAKTESIASFDSSLEIVDAPELSGVLTAVPASPTVPIPARSQPLQAGCGLVWEIIAPPWRTAPNPEPLSKLMKLPRLDYKFRDRSLSSEDVDIFLCRQTLVCWYIPIYFPSDRDLPIPHLSRPVWSRTPPPAPSAAIEAAETPPRPIYWTPQRVAEFWTTLNSIAVHGTMGVFTACVVPSDEDPAWGEHIRITCQADRALGFRKLLEGPYLTGATVALCDVRGQRILLA